ncbi:hypothetical protein PR202_ga11207 [Eleusine coracana subsp. coracana]|uniref:DUF4220 domain-containing protein n=1 Tax=Eleusine coracana subsp. coracana TaxID=191504 RepID=A0AAV5C8E2_ELECO|nr:hypothetical protein PR202_ga11207 [Eleusine coracana subsp. coracana]
MHAWKAWGIQALVLLSFTLQVTLVILAELRRCIDSGVLRFFVWSAYMAADSTAIYVLGHMSVTSRSPEHELMAFWAPFLLMHLGGQDSITAYAIEDNRLWLRHLQTLAVQAAAAGYVLYESFIVGSPSSLLRWATIIMFMVGIFKFVHAADWRRRCSWSRSMGQHNLFQVCTRSVTSRRSKIARWIEAEDWWNTLAYSWSIPISALIEKLLMDKVLACEGDDDLFDSRGQAELKRWGLYEHKGLDWSLENRIIMWHIATSMYLSWCCEKQQAKTSMAEAVEALSNYMMFLLASRPHMLPAPTASHNAYVEICYVLTTVDAGKGFSSVKDLLSSLWSIANALETTPTIQLESRLRASCALGAKLVREEEESPGENNNMLELLAQVWVEALCCTGKSCSAYSHAKQLSNGGELITVAALLVEHMKKFILIDRSVDAEIFNHDIFATPLYGVES